MATSEAISWWNKPARAWDHLLAGRPVIALAAVLFTTTGHTMNLREMGVEQGWVAAEFYALQTTYLLSLALTMLACAVLGQHWSCRALAQVGLVLSAAGSFLNGLDTWAPMSIFLAGRAVAGAGAGMVIYFAPRLLDPRWAFAAIWGAILFPVAGPGVVSAATTLLRGVSDWQGGFLVEGGGALVGLFALLSMAEAPESPPSPPQGSLAYLPFLAAACAAGVHVLHWGQLHGWMESYDIAATTVGGGVLLAIALWLAWPQLDFPALKENWIRLILFFFGGMNQFVHGYTMNTYGGSIVNFSSWQRAWLIWPMPIGIAAALALSQVRWRRRRLPLGLPGAVLGLALLAGGLYQSYQMTMEWPYWDPRSVVDLNWFPAPSHWQLAPGRLLMGLGVGLFMLAADTLFSPDPAREEKVRPSLLVMQFLGGGIAAGVFVNFLLIGHAVHYSYATERDYIQAGELAARFQVLASDIDRSGGPASERMAQALMFRFVNYEADNLVFATIYAAFLAAALALAAVCAVLWIWRLRQRFHRRIWHNADTETPGPNPIAEPG
jgi:MFS family permease